MSVTDSRKNDQMHPSHKAKAMGNGSQVRFTLIVCTSGSRANDVSDHLWNVSLMYCV